MHSIINELYKTNLKFRVNNDHIHILDQSIKYPDAIGVNTNLQSAIKEVVDNVKKNTALVEN